MYLYPSGLDFMWEAEIYYCRREYVWGVFSGGNKHSFPGLRITLVYHGQQLFQIYKVKFVIVIDLGVYY